MSTGKIAFQRISISETNCVIQWIEIYPVDSFIYLLNNQGRFNIFALLTRNWRTRMNFILCIFKMASPTWVNTQTRLYRTNILGFTKRKQKRWFRNVDNWILQSWSDYVKINFARQQHDTERNQNRAGLWPSTAVSPFLWLISTAQQTEKLCWKLPAHSDLSPDIELQLAKKIQVGQTNLKPNSLWHIRLRSFAVHVCLFRNDNSSWNSLKITDPPPPSPSIQ